eukprot:CAMPEP_0117660132 /NCGR_PEP_ID=MMETSP0804-20121206/6804_1 /TAXON_ID=1074897 /ORGANISM="Tetraselmis astigmatica, Strain CCMP880" /LENGTH=465 /DNA_ID=CAMNT_0005466839 /DNA_START=290 /DNA_END=1687 /DNA_ORIENTATION=-
MTWRVLDEASHLVTEAPCSEIRNDNFGRLLHVSCNLEPSGHVPEDSIGVAAPAGTALLQRRGQVLQWEEDIDERESEVQGHRKIIKTYRYSQVWEEHRIDSSLFRYPDMCIRGGSLYSCHNPPWPGSLEGPSKFWASTIDAGVFRLSRLLRNTIPADEPFLPPLEVYYGSDGETYRRTSEGLSTTLPGHTAEVGDIRVQYSINSAKLVSILGSQAYSPNANATFGAYTTPKGRMFRPVLVVGEESAAEMFNMLLQNNEVMAWLLRLAGWVACWVGLCLCIKPLELLVSWVPCVGECLGDLVFCALCCVAGGVSFASSTVVVSIAWLFYRPLISLPLIAVSSGILSFVLWRRCGAGPASSPQGYYPISGGSGPASHTGQAYPSGNGAYPPGPWYPTAFPLSPGGSTGAAYLPGGDGGGGMQYPGYPAGGAMPSNRPSAPQPPSGFDWQPQGGRYPPNGSDGRPPIV